MVSVWPLPWAGRPASETKSFFPEGTCLCERRIKRGKDMQMWSSVLVSGLEGKVEEGEDERQAGVSFTFSFFLQLAGVRERK